MKGLGYSTILLAFVIVLLVISVGMLGFLNYHVANNASETLADLWGNKKLILGAPAVLNLLSAAVLGVLLMSS